MSHSQLSPQTRQLSVNTIKMLAVDAVEKANSGHPGMPMGAADYAFVLWTQFLRYNPDDPAWIDRDRFVLSAGHGSMLLYGLLHLAGYDLSMEELQNFRQWGSRTPGHPEAHLTPGVETTTGPLGQGFANGVGMALSAKMAAARFNTADHPIFAHRVFGIVSDGDLMEGVAAEAASIAGHLGLGNLIYLYDDNRITIEGSTSLAYSDNVGPRFEGYHWHVQSIDGHDHDAAAAALKAAIAETSRPSLIICRTLIGHGAATMEGQASTHGSPLGATEIAATKEKLDWPESPTFLVPEEVREVFAERARHNRTEYDAWRDRFEAWSAANPELAASLEKHTSRSLPADLFEQLVAAAPKEALATRATSGKILQKAAELAPGLVGGSADLEPSTKTYIKASASVSRESFAGANLHYGVREHGMGGVMNGVALSGLFIPYGATFLIFSDYMRPSIRLAALSDLQAIYVFTHDSVFLGEDGPTHQPVEHLGALRLIPNLSVIRPFDAVETAAAWAIALERKHGPTALSLSRQKVPVVDRTGVDDRLALRGGYVLKAESRAPADLILMASGSEVPVAAAASEALEEAGYSTRVVSMPSPGVFERQPEDYRAEVLPAGPRRVSVEAGRSEPWLRWVGSDGLAIGIDRFGASAPYEVLADQFGLTAEKVTAAVKNWVTKTDG